MFDTQSGLFYDLPCHPRTCVPSGDDDGHSEFADVSAAGLRFRCVAPMKRWLISFDGALRVRKQGQCSASHTSHARASGDLIHVRFYFQWTAFTDKFSFDSDLPASALARATSLRPWSRLYFDMLKTSHQTHYEQWGTLQGPLVIGGIAVTSHSSHTTLTPLEHLTQDTMASELPCSRTLSARWIVARSLRDRSFGFRDWTMFPRYICHLITLDNGACMQLTLVTSETLSHLDTGYIIHACGEKVCCSGCCSDISAVIMLVWLLAAAAAAATTTTTTTATTSDLTSNQH
jgi:hypothetical protein